MLSKMGNWKILQTVFKHVLRDATFTLDFVVDPKTRLAVKAVTQANFIAFLQHEKTTKYFLEKGFDAKELLIEAIYEHCICISQQEYETYIEKKFIPLLQKIDKSVKIYVTTNYNTEDSKQ